MDKATCEADAEALRSSVDVHQEKTRALKEELNQQYSENSELLDQVRDLQQQQDQAKEREQLWQEDLEKAKQVMKILDEDKIEAQKESSSLQGDLETMKEQREALEARVTGLQSQIVKLEDKLSTTEKERDLVSTESHSIRVRLEEQLRELRNECATLTSSIASLELDNETYLSTTRSMEENKMDLQEKLEEER
ncbi:expressed unknown protein [Seminavis robusta]|uniref:Uncharacterized protein n=1 Tax=Seminavis robusta TaxID=568900 RepID=A0A9N8E5N6_9STRA|nr:expressed unknown protein [Seminavis robusta]|eukprot:Sro688_g187430.1 n/a (194) ;mRNA; f:39015-39596